MSYKVEWIPVEENQLLGHNWFIPMGKKHTDKVWVNTEEKGVSITDYGGVMYISYYETVTHYAHYFHPDGPGD